ncbi:MAG TPA: helix-turn-helix domain-containing protein [Marmoricola sp.]|nr:helix-turn-helix domain-containing protein [Marmoricola sp.]
MSQPTVTDPPRTRERILDVALGLFAEKGYDATSMREIAEQLGITKAALYYHFDSKADIVKAMLADTERRVGELADWAQAQPCTPELSRQVLTRWSDIMQARGLAAFRFVVANRAVIDEIDTDRRDSIHGCMGDLCAALVPTCASVEDQLRIRLALMSINMAGLVGTDIDADEHEVLAAARRLAVELLPES